MNETTKQAITSEIMRCAADVAEIAAESQAAERQGLQPGAVVPAYGTLDTPTTEGQQAKAARVSLAVETIDGLIDAQRAADLDRMTESANANDVATVQFALSREGITADELQALHDRHKGNYQLARAIIERAARDGIHIDGEVTAANAEGAKRVAAGVAAYFDGATAPSETQAAFMAAMIEAEYDNGTNAGAMLI